ncbi:hypothetical protein LR48_Vigan01g131200 [Vigna angularis]|uniref:Uncharacterized protein n=1 Tax=Phaseolus angularis TaxID=3914 RepID=A0A0L9TMS6_PHAAN|nr:hypothetical protein LR48_Vigan01g131200 [Vigna angularis]
MIIDLSSSEESAEKGDQGYENNTSSSSVPFLVSSLILGSTEVPDVVEGSVKLGKKLNKAHSKAAFFYNISLNKGNFDIVKHDELVNIQYIPLDEDVGVEPNAEVVAEDRATEDGEVVRDQVNGQGGDQE